MPAGAALHIPMRRLLTPTVIGLVGFFTLLSLSTGALTNYSAVALVALYGVSLVGGESGAVGVPVRFGDRRAGRRRDRGPTRRHGDVAAFGFGGAAVLILLVGTVNLGRVPVSAAMGLPASCRA